MRHFLFAILLSGCGASGDGVPNSDNDASNGCAANIAFTPASPKIGDTVRASAIVSGIVALPSYQWTVMQVGTGGLAFMNAQADGSAIEFVPPAPGDYHVTLDLLGTASCPTAINDVNVLSDSTTTTYRLRVLPPSAPPQVKVIAIPKNLPTFAFGGDDLDSGQVIHAVVSSGGSTIPAYVRISPLGNADAVVEAYANSTGAISAMVSNEMQNVLVIPSNPALAPQQFQTAFASPQTFSVDPGSAISGIVKAPNGSGLAGAHVQLTVTGVPSTLALTAADGSFTVRTSSTTASPQIAIDVTPPAASGLPRLSAVGNFDPTSSMAIAYRSTIVIRDLVGSHLQRAGANLPSAQITLVGTLSDAGTINVNGTMAPATGAIHQLATADATGALPSLKAPAVPLSGVVQVASGDLAVASFDLTTAVPATINAPAMVRVNPVVNDATGTPIAGVTVDAMPTLELALAGAQPMRAITDASGIAGFSLAAGATYDFRLQDLQARVGPLVASPVLTNSFPSTPFAMPAATIVNGSVEINGLGPTAGAAVQLLCNTCSGTARTQPIIAVTTDAAGNYKYAVPRLQ